MFRIATLTAAAALVAMIGLAGTAKAQTELLTNGDAETGDLTGWVVDAGDPAAVSDLSFIDVAPIGTEAFDMGPFSGAPVGSGGTAILRQTVEDSALDGCNVNVNGVDLLGAWTLDAFYVTEVAQEDFGTISIEFFKPVSITLLFLELDNLVSANDDAWVQILATSGDISCSHIRGPCTWSNRGSTALLFVC